MMYPAIHRFASTLPLILNSRSSRTPFLRLSENSEWTPNWGPVSRQKGAEKAQLRRLVPSQTHDRDIL
jgi:hypothetical protein